MMVGYNEVAGFGAGFDPNGPTGGGGNPYPQGQCTYGVWQYVHDHFGVDMPDLPGNATDWFADAQQRGWETTSTPTENTAVAWSNTKYPPFGHVAWVLSIQSGPIQGSQEAIASIPNDVTFTVYEWNFSKDLEPDNRTIKLGSKDAEGIEGFIKVPGVTPGQSLNQGIAGGATNPWGEFLRGIQDSEHQVQDAVTSFLDKVVAAGEISLGGLIMAGGGYMLAKGQLPTPARVFPAANSPSPRTRPAPLLAPAPRVAPTPAPAAPKSSPVKALNKVTSGRFSELTPAEVEWVQGHPLEVKEALRAAGKAA